MNTLESFSLSTNLAPAAPHLQRDYFPLDIDLSRAVLILNTFEDQRKTARVYDYFQDVIDFSANELAKHGYFFFQPLTGREPVLRCANSTFNLTPNQVAYLIDGCAAVISNDGVYSHVANEAGVKCLTLFGSSSPSAHTPKFNPDVFTSIRESNNAPSYRSNESPKQVNENKIETVIKSLFSLLSLKCQSPLKTVYMGQHYGLKFLEVIPDCVLSPDNFKSDLVTFRMDYLHDENALFANLQYRKCNVIVKNPLDLDKLKAFKTNIVNFNYEIDKNVDLGYVKKLIKTGVKITFFSDEKDADLSLTRMKMLDVGIVESLEKPGVVPEVLAKITEDTHYRSNKFTLSDGKIYSSYSAYLNKTPIPSFNQNIVKFDKDNPLLWEDLRFCYLFDLTRTG
jgi:hypothetical protein